MSKETVLAVDLGAESGRVMGVHFDGQNLTLEELHRFPNHSVAIHGTLYWDILELWRNIQKGIDKGKRLNPVSLGLDTWGVDFALLDSQGDLVGNPVHYRDGRTQGMMEKVFEMVPREQIFSQTGIQFMAINTLYQMMSLVVDASPQLTAATTFLTMPDILNYWLTGIKTCEFSNATTTQMFNPITGSWAASLLDQLGIPSHIFPEIIQPGTRLGDYEGLAVIAPACHDTGSAVAAVPAKTSNFAYISSGTWSLAGLEVDRPIINADALKANATNEGGVYGTYRFLKNIMGLWIVQQCRATWQKEGTSLSYPHLVEIAQVATPFTAFIDPDDMAFLKPGDHPRLIREMCQQSGQIVPETKGAVVRVVLESLAMTYRRVIEQLAAISKRKIEVIHILGGGSQNTLLNQMTADAAGLPVIAGPAEATVIGNALVQLITQGELNNIQEARHILAESGSLRRYEPQSRNGWDDAYERFKNLLS